MRWKNSLSVFALTAMILSSTMAGAAVKTLSVSHALGEPGASVIVDITVDNAAEIAGASFTVTYEKAKLTLTNVESNFFGTFLAQGITNPSTVVVDGITYDNPLVHNSTAGAAGSMIAAARKDNGTGLNRTLFTLTFHINETATFGVTPITIVSSIINNVTAGYSASGEAIPLLVGMGSDATHYLSYPDQTDPGYAVSIISGSISIDLQFVDSENGGTPDGISDNWEMLYFANLITANAISDYDKDGYSDLQEYLNRWEKDQNSASYDPRIKNAAGGTGYVESKHWALPIVNLLLLE
jgi:hypothetical protein